MSKQAKVKIVKRNINQPCTRPSLPPASHSGRQERPRTATRRQSLRRKREVSGVKCPPMTCRILTAIIRPTFISASPSSPMARLLAQILILAHPAPSTATNPGSLLPLRGLATKVEVIVSDDDASAPAAAGSPSAQVMEIRRLEDALHGVMVRRATPDWLPFVPGGSFWMPPMRRPHEVAELIGRISAFGEEEDNDADEAEAYAHMTEEEARSFSTVRGWPSAAYFIEGSDPVETVEEEVEYPKEAGLDEEASGMEGDGYIVGVS